LCMCHSTAVKSRYDVATLTAPTIQCIIVAVSNSDESESNYLISLSVILGFITPSTSQI
jgi:hypothetical protein